MKTQLLIVVTLFTNGILFSEASFNWKQCVWKSEDKRENGLIKDCLFNKMFDKTALRVFYSGSLSVQYYLQNCRRWFFTFNGVECSGPMSIDGIEFMYGTADIFAHGYSYPRVRHIEGYCENIPKGGVRVGINVETCPDEEEKTETYTGSKSVARIVVEEVQAPQQ